MKARNLIAKEKEDMVSAVQANLLLSSLGMTREEILIKYPSANDCMTETIENELSHEKPMDQHQRVCDLQPFPAPNGSNEDQEKPVFMQFIDVR